MYRSIKPLQVVLPEGRIYEFGEKENHYLRPRKIFCDNKSCVYSVNIDYLYPFDQKPLSDQEIRNYLTDGIGVYSDDDYPLIYWNIKYISTNQCSDHFDLDHKEYYENILG